MYFDGILIIIDSETNRVRGRRHLRYLRQHSKALYTKLQLSGKLNGYLADLNEQAEDMFFELVKQMAVRKRFRNSSRPRIKCCGYSG